MRNIAHHLGRVLSVRHDVRILAVRLSDLERCRRAVAAFRPDVIHYTSGPSILSLLVLRLAALASPRSKTVVSAVHPWFPARSDRLIPLVRPGLVLVQSKATDRFFRRYGCRTAFLSNGVDLTRFRPVPPSAKSVRRAELCLPEDKYLILHVGALKLGRGVDVLRTLQGGDRQMLIVGSVSSGYEAAAQKELEAQGCLVWMRYLPDIEKVYAAADCYAFPTRKPLFAIEIPLSVLEAMAANLPVIAAPFGALPDTFAEGEGLIYADSAGEFERAVQRIREGSVPIRTREKVLGLSWEAVTEKLEKAYSDLVMEGTG
jgi:glycosyltransferase involved in cell wall biosynthesis